MRSRVLFCLTATVLNKICLPSNPCPSLVFLDTTPTARPVTESAGTVLSHNPSETPPPPYTTPSFVVFCLSLCVLFREPVTTCHFTTVVLWQPVSRTLSVSGGTASPWEKSLRNKCLLSDSRRIRKRISQKETGVCSPQVRKMKVSVGSCVHWRGPCVGT